MKIAIAQMNATVGDLTGNVAKIVEFSERARVAGANVVVTPELAVCGYPPEDLLLRDDFLARCAESVSELKKRVRGITLIVGHPRVDQLKRYNSASVLCDGKVIGVYDKHNLPNYTVFDEKRYFERARRACVFAWDGVRLGVNICEDVSAPASPPAVDEAPVGISSPPSRKRSGSSRSSTASRREARSRRGSNRSRKSTARSRSGSRLRCQERIPRRGAGALGRRRFGPHARHRGRCARRRARARDHDALALHGRHEPRGRAGGFGVLKDIDKRLVYSLARYRNGISPVIPQRVFDRPPSAELKADQTDQDSLPPSILDAILEAYIEEDMDPAEIVARGHSRGDVERVVGMVRVAEYKCRQARIGVRITGRAFGKDWRYPITNRFRHRF